jgi:tetratricopeptide (TPR) repeat protein
LLLQRGRVEEAEAAFHHSAELDPSFAEPTLALIELLIDTGREDEALPLLETVVERDPRNEGAMVALGNIYLERQRFEEAIAMLERWREHSPFSHESKVLFGRLLYEVGDLDRAFDVFDEMFKANPGSAELARILGEILLTSGRTEDARSYFEQAIAIDPAYYRSYLALFFAGTRRFATSAGSEHTIEMTDDERRSILLQASEYAPGSDFEANYLMGASLLSLDLLDDAERHLLRAKELGPRDFQTLFNLASVYEKRGEFERAEPLLTDMLEDRPDDPSVLNFYGYVLSQMRKDLPRALGMLAKALRAEPRNGYYLDSLGWIYYQMGDYARAVVELEKASEIVNDDPVILEHLGDAYAASRRFREARAAYQRSHELQGGSDILRKIETTPREDP